VADLVSTQPGSNIFLREGICPLPDHLKKKILNLEYVDMADLRPEVWLMAISDAEAKNYLTSLFGRRKQPVTDVSVGAMLVSVLVEKYPQYIKHFLAYQSTIVMGASLSWVAYDAAYRRKAVQWTSICKRCGSLTKLLAQPASPALAQTIQQTSAPRTRPFQYWDATSADAASAAATTAGGGNLPTAAAAAGVLWIV
jgi:hypothetical protein